MKYLAILLLLVGCTDRDKLVEIAGRLCSCHQGVRYLDLSIGSHVLVMCNSGHSFTGIEDLLILSECKSK